nr:MAG: ORF1a protein [Wenzhou bat astrovirus 1]
MAARGGPVAGTNKLTMASLTDPSVMECVVDSPIVLGARPKSGEESVRKKRVRFIEGETIFPWSTGRELAKVQPDSGSNVEKLTEVELDSSSDDDWQAPLLKTRKKTVPQPLPRPLVFGYGWRYLAKLLGYFIMIGMVIMMVAIVWSTIQAQAQRIKELEEVLANTTTRVRTVFKPPSWNRIYLHHPECLRERQWQLPVQPLVTFLVGWAMYSLSRFDWTLLWLARSVSFLLSGGYGSGWVAYWLYGPESAIISMPLLNTFFVLIVWNIMVMLLWMKERWLLLIVHVVVPVASNVLLYYYPLLNFEPNLQSTGVMFFFMGILPMAMKVALWSQGSSVTRVDWRGHMEKLNEVNWLQQLVQKFMNFKQGPDRTVKWKPNKHVGKTRWEMDVRQAFDVSSERPHFKLEADMGAPWIPMRVVEHVTPWSVLHHGERVGSGFHYKGAFVTPNHVWEVVGKTDTIEVERNGKMVTVEKTGIIRTHGEDLITFRGVPGVTSIRLSKQTGVVACFSVTMNGTKEYGITFGAYDVNKRAHDCTTKPGDSGVPIVDSYGMLLGIHVSSSPGSNHAVTPESIWLDEVACDCGMLCTCNVYEARRGGTKWKKMNKWGRMNKQRGKRVRWFTDSEYQALVDKGLSKQAIAELIRMRAYNGFQPYEDDDSSDDSFYALATGRGVYDDESVKPGCEPVWLDFSTKWIEVEGVKLPQLSSTIYGRVPMETLLSDMSQEQKHCFLEEAKRQPARKRDPRQYVYYKNEKGTGMSWRNFESLGFQVGPSGPEKTQ